MQKIRLEAHDLSKSNTPAILNRNIIPYKKEQTCKAIVEIFITDFVRKIIVTLGIIVATERITKNVLNGSRKLIATNKNIPEMIMFADPQKINPLAILPPAYNYIIETAAISPSVEFGLFRTSISMNTRFSIPLQ